MRITYGITFVKNQIFQNPWLSDSYNIMIYFCLFSHLLLSPPSVNFPMDLVGNSLGGSDGT